MRAGLVYFLMVMGTGFVLGAIRVPLLVPRLGVRWAELAEMPVMAAVIFRAAGYILQRFPEVRSSGRSVAAGLLALALLVCAELSLTVALQDQSVASFIAGRDRVSGTVYLAMLVVYGLMPRLRLAGS